MRRIRLMSLSGLALAALLMAVSLSMKGTLRAQPPASTVASAFVGGGFGGGQEPPERAPTSPLSISLAEAKTRLKLHDKIPLNFPNDTTLQDVLKAIREATVDKIDFPDGLAIYVDPIGLQDADKTITSTVAIELKGIPLATSLKLTLDQLNLAYWVNPDGLIIITSNHSEDLPDGSENPLARKLSEIQRELWAVRNEIRALRGLPPAVGMGGGMGGGANQAKGQTGGFR